MSQMPPDHIELRTENSLLVVSPAAGGSITRFASTRGGSTVEWLRPALPNAVASRTAGATSSFPMVPFSNRIQNGTFSLDGRRIQLPQNFQKSLRNQEGESVVKEKFLKNRSQQVQAKKNYNTVPSQTLTRNLTQKHHPLTIHSFYFTLPSASHHPLGHPLTIHSTDSSSTRYSTRRNSQTMTFDSGDLLVAQGHPCAVSQNVFIA